MVAFLLLERCATSHGRSQQCQIMRLREACRVAGNCYFAAGAQHVIRGSSFMQVAVECIMLGEIGNAGKGKRVAEPVMQCTVKRVTAARRGRKGSRHVKRSVKEKIYSQRDLGGEVVGKRAMQKAVRATTE